MVAVPVPNNFSRQPEGLPTTARSFDQRNQEQIENFNDLVLLHQNAVYEHALWIMGDEDSAEDATQEAFIRAFRNINTYNGGPFRPWILRIATNYCFDMLRRQKRRANIPLDGFYDNGDEINEPSWLIDTEASIEAQVERSEMQAWIRRHINRLPVKYRAVVILVDIQQLDYKEAASVLGIHMGTFKSRLCRARMQLQKWMQNDRRMLYN